MEMDVEANLKIFADFFCFSPLVAPFFGQPHAYSIPMHVPSQPQPILHEQGDRIPGMVNIFLLILGKFATNKADNT